MEQILDSLIVEIGTQGCLGFKMKEFWSIVEQNFNNIAFQREFGIDQKLQHVKLSERLKSFLWTQLIKRYKNIIQFIEVDEEKQKQPMTAHSQQKCTNKQTNQSCFEQYLESVQHMSIVSDPQQLAELLSSQQVCQKKDVVVKLKEEVWQGMLGVSQANMGRFPLSNKQIEIIARIASSREAGVLQADLSKLCKIENRNFHYIINNLMQRGFISKQPIFMDNKATNTNILHLARFQPRFKLKKHQQYRAVAGKIQQHGVDTHQSNDQQVPGIGHEDVPQDNQKNEGQSYQSILNNSQNNTQLDTCMDNGINEKSIDADQKIGIQKDDQNNSNISDEKDNSHKVNDNITKDASIQKNSIQITNNVLDDTQDQVSNIFLNDDSLIMKAILDKIQSTREKVVLEQELKQALGFKFSQGHRAYRRIKNKLNRMNYIESLTSEVDGKQRILIKLLRPWEEQLQDQTFVQAQENNSFGLELLQQQLEQAELDCMQQDGQIYGKGLNRQIMDMIIESGDEGVLSNQISERFKLDSKRILFHIKQVAENFNIQSRTENQGKMMVNRYLAPPALRQAQLNPYDRNYAIDLQQRRLLEDQQMMDMDRDTYQYNNNIPPQIQYDPHVVQARQQTSEPDIRNQIIHTTKNQEEQVDNYKLQGQVVHFEKQEDVELDGDINSTIVKQQRDEQIQKPILQFQEQKQSQGSDQKGNLLALTKINQKSKQQGKLGNGNENYKMVMQNKNDKQLVSQQQTRYVHGKFGRYSLATEQCINLIREELRNRGYFMQMEVKFFLRQQAMLNKDNQALNPDVKTIKRMFKRLENEGEGRVLQLMVAQLTEAQEGQEYPFILRSDVTNDENLQAELRDYTIKMKKQVRSKDYIQLSRTFDERHQGKSKQEEVKEYGRLFQDIVFTPMLKQKDPQDQREDRAKNLQLVLGTSSAEVYMNLTDNGFIPQKMVRARLLHYTIAQLVALGENNMEISNKLRSDVVNKQLPSWHEQKRPTLVQQAQSQPYGMLHQWKHTNYQKNDQKIIDDNNKNDNNGSPRENSLARVSMTATKNKLPQKDEGKELPGVIDQDQSYLKLSEIWNILPMKVFLQIVGSSIQVSEDVKEKYFNQEDLVVKDIPIEEFQKIVDKYSRKRFVDLLTILQNLGLIERVASMEKVKKHVSSPRNYQLRVRSQATIIINKRNPYKTKKDTLPQEKQTGQETQVSSQLISSAQTNQVVTKDEPSHQGNEQSVTLVEKKDNLFRTDNQQAQMQTESLNLNEKITEYDLKDEYQFDKYWCDLEELFSDLSLLKTSQRSFPYSACPEVASKSSWSTIKLISKEQRQQLRQKIFELDEDQIEYRSMKEVARELNMPFYIVNNFMRQEGRKILNKKRYLKKDFKNLNRNSLFNKHQELFQSYRDPITGEVQPFDQDFMKSRPDAISIQKYQSIDEFLKKRKDQKQKQLLQRLKGQQKETDAGHLSNDVNEQDLEKLENENQSSGSDQMVEDDDDDDISDNNDHADQSQIGKRKELSYQRGDQQEESDKQVALYNDDYSKEDYQYPDIRNLDKNSKLRWSKAAHERILEIFVQERILVGYKRKIDWEKYDNLPHRPSACNRRIAMLQQHKSIKTDFEELTKYVQSLHQLSLDRIKAESNRDLKFKQALQIIFKKANQQQREIPKLLQIPSSNENQQSLPHISNTMDVLELDKSTRDKINQEYLQEVKAFNILEKDLKKGLQNPFDELLKKGPHYRVGKSRYYNPTWNNVKPIRRQHNDITLDLFGESQEFLNPSSAYGSTKQQSCDQQVNKKSKPDYAQSLSSGKYLSLLIFQIFKIKACQFYGEYQAFIQESGNGSQSLSTTVVFKEQIVVTISEILKSTTVLLLFDDNPHSDALCDKLQKKFTQAKIRQAFFKLIWDNVIGYSTQRLAFHITAQFRQSLNKFGAFDYYYNIYKTCNVKQTSQDDPDKQLVGQQENNINIEQKPYLKNLSNNSLQQQQQVPDSIGELLNYDLADQEMLTLLYDIQKGSLNLDMKVSNATIIQIQESKQISQSMRFSDLLDNTQIGKGIHRKEEPRQLQKSYWHQYLMQQQQEDQICYDQLLPDKVKNLTLKEDSSLNIKEEHVRDKREPILSEDAPISQGSANRAISFECHHRAWRDIDEKPNIIILKILLFQVQNMLMLNSTISQEYLCKVLQAFLGQDQSMLFLDVLIKKKLIQGFRLYKQHLSSPIQIGTLKQRNMQEQGYITYYVNIFHRGSLLSINNAQEDSW